VDIIKISIKGTRPLLMHSDKASDPMSMEAKEMKAISGKRKKTDEDQDILAQLDWKSALYYDKHNSYHIPAKNLVACIRDAAKFTKQGKEISRYVSIIQHAKIDFKQKNLTPEQLWNYSLENGNKYIDRQSVKVNMGSKVYRTRPIFEDWETTFDVIYEPEKIDYAVLISIIKTAGSYVAVGDYRPMYGTFEITKIDRE
jgi:hypothetical protein